MPIAWRKDDPLQLPEYVSGDKCDCNIIAVVSNGYTVRILNDNRLGLLISTQKHEIGDDVAAQYLRSVEHSGRQILVFLQAN